MFCKCFQKSLNLKYDKPSSVHDTPLLISVFCFPAALSVVKFSKCSSNCFLNVKLSGAFISSTSFIKPLITLPHIGLETLGSLVLICSIHASSNKSKFLRVLVSTSTVFPLTFTNHIGGSEVNILRLEMSGIKVPFPIPNFLV